MFNASQQKLVILLIVSGACVFLCGGFGYATTLSNTNFVIVLVGLALAGGGIYYGFKTAGGDNASKPVETADHVYIMNILIINKRGDHVFDPEMYDPEELKHIVQIAMPGGRREEFETHPDVLATMGEGMRGRITYQGKWLNRFEAQHQIQDR